MHGAAPRRYPALLMIVVASASSKSWEMLPYLPSVACAEMIVPVGNAMSVGVHSGKRYGLFVECPAERALMVFS